MTHFIKYFMNIIYFYDVEYSIEIINLKIDR
jgi:uncharacterized protein YqgQ